MNTSCLNIGFESGFELQKFGLNYCISSTESEKSLHKLNSYKYVGKERDEETGLYYYGARYYAAWLCRFVSVDPLQHKYPYYTPYQYAGNKPITYIDLDGLEEVDKSEQNTNRIDYIEAAIKATVAVKNDIEAAWEKTGHGGEKVNEYGGAIIIRDNEYKAVNIIEGHSSNVKPRISGGEINKKTDTVVGDFHNHPYSKEELQRAVGAYNTDGEGIPFSGGDFTSIANTSDKKVGNGYFSVVNSGEITYIMVFTDVDAYKAIFDGVIGDILANKIDEKIEESILNEDNMERNPNATNPMTYEEAYLKGLIEALKDIESANGSLGITILKSENDINYEKIF